VLPAGSRARGASADAHGAISGGITQAPARRIKERPHRGKGSPACRRADAVLFVTPEYNRSIPGVLKNAIDNASRPYGQSAWKGKPAGVMGASPGAPGTSMAQQHLRNILAYLDMPTLAQPEVFIQVKDGLFGENGEVTSPETKQFLQGWMDRYTAWVKTFVTL
jgi:chromate reductase